MGKFLLHLCVFCLFQLSFHAVLAQKLPSGLNVSADGKRLVFGSERVKGFYDTASIKEVRLFMSQPDYWAQLESNYNSNKDLLGKMVYEGKTYDSVGIAFKGQTSYRRNSATKKKSFTVNLEFVRSGQNVEGYEALNFNNAFDDPSYLHEVLYGILARKHMPTVRTNFIHLYINNQDFGVYPNVQQVNGEFIREWWFSNDGVRWRADSPTGTGGPGGGGGPGWGKGKAAINFLGDAGSAYQTYYTLKRSEQEDPWGKLAATAKALNQTPIADLEKVLPQYLDVDRTLWYLACEIAFGDDDSYVFKGEMDYYLYWDPETKRLTPIEVDGNSAMLSGHTTWSPFYNETNVNYPLLNRMLAVPAWRQRFLAHMRAVNEESINPAVSHIHLDRLAKKIDPLAKTDPEAIYGYTRFGTEVPNLRKYFTDRYAFIKNHAEVNKTVPKFNGTAHWVDNVEGKLPQAKQVVQVRSKVINSEGISKVWLYFANNLTGTFSKIEMRDDGKSNDLAANDGTFGANIPGFDAYSYVRYYIEAVSSNSVATVQYDPVGAEHDVYFYQVQPPPTSNLTVVINEVLASNTKDLDENKQTEDWIELYNTTNSRIDLSGYFLSDNLTLPQKWAFPKNTFIEPKGFLTVWADEDGSQGPLHVNFKIAKSGELIILSDPSGKQLDRAEFGAQQDDMGFARVPDGMGAFVVQKSSFNRSNQVSTPTREVEIATFNMYPNPAREQVIVEADALLQGKIISVFNSQGRLVARQIAETRNTINTNDWPSGAYFLRIGETGKKLLIMR